MTHDFGIPRVLMTDNGSAYQQRLSYAMAKQVPAMERGFTISTNYGDIWIDAEDAEPFQRLAKLMLNQKLANAIAAEKEMGDGC